MYRQSSPEWTQRIWDAIVRLQGKSDPGTAVPKERLLNSLCEDVHASRDCADAELGLAAADGLVVPLKVDDDGSLSYLLPLSIRKFDNDWFCFHCHMGGRDDSMDCQLCFRMFHLDCAAGYSGLSVWSEKLICPVCKQMIQWKGYDFFHQDPMTLPDLSERELNELLESVISKFLGYSCLKFGNGQVWAIYSDRKYADQWRYNFLVHTSISGKEMLEKASNKRYSCLRLFLNDCELLSHNLAVYFGRDYGKIPWVEKFQNIVFNAVNGIQKCPDCFRMSLTKKTASPCKKQHISVQLDPPERLTSVAVPKPEFLEVEGKRQVPEVKQERILISEEVIKRKDKVEGFNSKPRLVKKDCSREHLRQSENLSMVSAATALELGTKNIQRPGSSKVVAAAHSSKSQSGAKDSLDTESSSDEDSTDSTIYIVERILDAARFNGQMNYFVKWDGYSSDVNTWEPAEHILDPQLIEDYYSTATPSTETASSKRGKRLKRTTKTKHSGSKKSESPNKTSANLKNSVRPARRSRLRKTPYTSSNPPPASGRPLRCGLPEVAVDKDSPVRPKLIIRFGRVISGFSPPGSGGKPSPKTRGSSRQALSIKSILKETESTVVIDDQNSGGSESSEVSPNVSSSSVDSGVESNSSPDALPPRELSRACSYSSLMNLAMDWDETLALLGTEVEVDECLTFGSDDPFRLQDFGNSGDDRSFSSCSNLEKNIFSG